MPRLVRLIQLLALLLPLVASDGGFLFAQQESNPRAMHDPSALAAKQNPFATAANAGGVLVHPDTYAHLSKTLSSSASSGRVSSSSSSSGQSSGSSSTNGHARAPTQSERTTLEVMRMQPSAVWIDAKSKLYGPDGSATAQGALASAARRKPAPLVVFVLCARVGHLSHAHSLASSAAAAASSHSPLSCRGLPSA